MWNAIACTNTSAQIEIGMIQKRTMEYIAGIYLTMNIPHANYTKIC